MNHVTLFTKITQRKWRLGWLTPPKSRYRAFKLYSGSRVYTKDNFDYLSSNGKHLLKQQRIQVSVDQKQFSILFYDNIWPLD